MGEPEQVLDVHIENRKYGSEVLSPNNMNVLLTVQKTMFKADGLMSNVVGFMMKRINDGQPNIENTHMQSFLASNFDLNKLDGRIILSLSSTCILIRNQRLV